jgi:hypothetical protein
MARKSPQKDTTVARSKPTSARKKAVIPQTPNEKPPRSGSDLLCKIIDLLKLLPLHKATRNQTFDLMCDVVALALIPVYAWFSGDHEGKHVYIFVITLLVLGFFTWSHKTNKELPK